MILSLFLCICFILWLLFGSLSTVLTERWRNHKWGILLWRSECIYCHHMLSAKELIPLFSYIFQRGRCLHCSKKISISYPLSELFMAILFTVISYKILAWWYDLFSIQHFVLLSCAFITWVYTIYDIRYMEIPDKIMIPGIWGIIILSTLVWIFPDFSSLFFDFPSYDGDTKWMLLDHLYGAGILYTFLYLQILIPGSWHLISHQQFKELKELLLGYFLFPIMLLFGKFNTPHDKWEDITIPTWVGGGDLRIALFIGLSLGTIHGIASFFFAYIIGSIIGIYILLRKGRTQKSHEIPFWPFLAIGWVLAIFFYEDILDIIYIL